MKGLGLILGAVIAFLIFRDAVMFGYMCGITVVVIYHNIWGIN